MDVDIPKKNNSQCELQDTAEKTHRCKNVVEVALCSVRDRVLRTWSDRCVVVVWVACWVVVEKTSAII